MEKAAIVADNLTIKYGDFTAANKVSFIVPRGEIFGFLGPNGSGKTTIIKTLCGLITPTSGSGSILGFDTQLEAEEVKKRIGYMSQKFSLYEDLTVSENIDFYAGVYDLSGIYLKQRKMEIVALLGLGTYLDKRAGQLSGGWKQRLGLACAIIHKPDVVFLDEPTAGIDPVARRELWDLLFRLSGQGMTFFVTTHYIDEAERCGRVGYVYYSKLIAYGTIDELKRLPGISPEGTIRVEVTCANASAALMFVKNLLYVREATIYGQTIHILMNADKTLEKLSKDLAEFGFGETEIRAIKPSLEDVFVTLTNELNKEKISGQNTISEADQVKSDKAQTAKEMSLPKPKVKRAATRKRSVFAGLVPMFRKELVHISRDFRSIIFVIVFTMLQSILIGFAVNTNERQISTVVCDLAQTQESKLLIEKFKNTDDFKIVGQTNSDKQMYDAIVAGQAIVGIKIPVDYSKRLLNARKTGILILVNASNTVISTEAINVSNVLILRESLKKILAKTNVDLSVEEVLPKSRPSPIEAKHVVLFNPNSRTSSFIFPGLVPFLMQGMLLILVSTAFVREKEKGTLEQIYLTPIGPMGLMLGKALPYALVGFLLQTELLSLASFVFGVPFRGSYLLLLFFTVPFLIVVLGLGLLIAVKAQSLLEASQMAINLYVPSAFLSGYLFDFNAMPVACQWIGRFIPITYYIDITRGILLRGADFYVLWPNAVAMLAIGGFLFFVVSKKFLKPTF